MVGLPWGQFHGACRSLRLSSTLRIVFASSAFPIMMLERHARMASMARTLDGRTISDTDKPDRGCGRLRESPTVSCDLAGNVLALIQHADQLVHVVGAEGDALAEGHGVEREAANRRRRLVDFAKSKAVGEKRGHVSVHRLRLRGGQLQLFGDQERLPVQRRGALEPFEVVDRRPC